jgi:hypothetical protein
MPMSLDEWRDWRTGPQGDLDKIAAASMMVETHAKRLLVRPDWETIAEVELDLAAMTLRAALARIERAQAIYREKGIDK